MGYGNIGACHALAYHSLEGFAICGLVSTGKSKEVLDKNLGGLYPLFSDFEEAMENTKPATICISTYPDTLESFAIRALKQGCHVFIEKPWQIVLPVQKG